MSNDQLEQIGLLIGEHAKAFYYAQPRYGIKTAPKLIEELAEARADLDSAILELANATNNSELEQHVNSIADFLADGDGWSYLSHGAKPELGKQYLISMEGSDNVYFGRWTSTGTDLFGEVDPADDQLKAIAFRDIPAAAKRAL